MPAYHWPGFSPPWRSYYDLVVDNLSRISISVELKPEEYGKWVTTTSLGKFEKMAIAPVTRFTEIDDWLYGIHYPSCRPPESRRRRRAEQAPGGSAA